MKENYETIRTQSDLQRLAVTVGCDDTMLVEFHVGTQRQSYFPMGIKSSGKYCFHYHCIYQACCAPTSHLEVVFVGTENFPEYYYPFCRLVVNGIVNDCGSVVLNDRHGCPGPSCVRIIYRYLNLEDFEAYGYFQRPGVLDYPEGAFSEDGYFCLSNDSSHILITKEREGVDLMVCDNDHHSQTVSLSAAQMKQIAEILCQAIDMSSS